MQKARQERRSLRVVAVALCLALAFTLVPFAAAQSAFAEEAGVEAGSDITTTDFQTSALEYPQLIFNPQDRFVDRVTLTQGSSPVLTAGDLVYDRYLVPSYVANPVVGKQFQFSASADHYKMYIYVPVSYGTTDFTQVSNDDRPILFKVNWGGDMAFPVSGTVNTDQTALTAMIKGWVVADPSILGVNCVATGVDAGPNGETYYNYGKAPYPIAGLKAAIRYLRYSVNEETIPGNKERIIATGFSSGGCGTVMLAASGNATLYNNALGVLGAAPGRDDIYATLGSAPIIPRDFSDQAIAYVRFWWLDFDSLDTSTMSADEQLAVSVNRGLVQSWKEYVPTLGLRAEYAVDGVAVGDAITADNMLAYYYPYLKDSCLKYLNGLGSRAAIDTYLASERGTGGAAMARSELIVPVYAADGVTVVDIEGTVGGIWKTWVDYTYRIAGFGGPGLINHGLDPTMVDYGFDKPYIAPLIGDNGVLEQANAAGYTTVGTQTFGKATDYAATYSPFGLDWIVANGKSVSQEYRALYEMQCRSMDPMYFIRNAEALGVTVAQHWFIRSGAMDTICLPGTFLSLTTTLQNRGYDVNSGIVWDVGHASTPEWGEFFTWYAALNDAPAIYPVMQHFGSYAGSGSLSAIIGGNDMRFTRLTYNGAAVDQQYYTVTKGSTVITLSEAYLKSLPNGTYTFVAEFSDGRSENITLTITLASTGTGPGMPQTGDSLLLPLAAATLAACGIALFASVMWRRRRVTQ